MPLADEMVDILDGCRLNKSDLRSQVKSIKAVSDEVKNGRIYIIFPEGGYYHNRNTVQEFLPGAFKAAMMAKPANLIRYPASLSMLRSFSIML